jgi:hypothetical protein
VAPGSGCDGEICRLPVTVQQSGRVPTPAVLAPSRTGRSVISGQKCLMGASCRMFREESLPRPVACPRRKLFLTYYPVSAWAHRSWQPAPPVSISSRCGSVVRPCALNHSRALPQGDGSPRSQTG